MPVSIYSILVAALIPMLVGFAWYNPKTLGGIWMREADVSEEKMKGANMGLIFGLSLLFSFLLAFELTHNVVHQMGVFSLSIANPDGENTFREVMERIGGVGMHRSFGHGALHGAIAGLFIAFPILAINAMFERKSWKYIWINAGFWIICLTLMGGIICAWT